MKRVLIILLPPSVIALSLVWLVSPPLTAQRVIHPRETRLGKVYDPPPGTEKFQAHPRTQDAKVRVTLADLKRWEKELSNWGRWGPDDQRGTLNLITQAKSREAARLATGRRDRQSAAFRRVGAVERQLENGARRTVAHGRRPRRLEFRHA